MGDFLEHSKCQPHEEGGRPHQNQWQEAVHPRENPGFGESAGRGWGILQKLNRRVCVDRLIAVEILKDRLEQRPMVDRCKGKGDPGRGVKRDAPLKHQKELSRFFDSWCDPCAEHRTRADTEKVDG